MIRGAMILAVGFSLGYAKALHDQEDIREGLNQMIEMLKESQPKTDTPETVDGTVTENNVNETQEGESDQDD